jgi:hypothetical protein
MTTDKIAQYLEQMAVKLGVAAEHVYGVLVRQQFAEGAAFIVGGLVYLIFFAFMVRWLYGKYIETKHDYKSDWDVAYVLFSLFGGLAAVGALFCVLLGTMRTLNPEYYAIREIMDVIGGVVR